MRRGGADQHGRRRAGRRHDAVPLRAEPRASAVAAGNIKGMVDYYRNPDTQRAFAEKNDQDVRKVTSFADATKLSMETTVLANATGFRVGRRGMYGPACANVREMATLLTRKPCSPAASSTMRSARRRTPAPSW